MWRWRRLVLVMVMLMLPMLMVARVTISCHTNWSQLILTGNELQRHHRQCACQQNGSGLHFQFLLDIAPTVGPTLWRKAAPDQRQGVPLRHLQPRVFMAVGVTRLQKGKRALQSPRATAPTEMELTP